MNFISVTVYPELVQARAWSNLELIRLVIGTCMNFLILCMRWGALLWDGALNRMRFDEIRNSANSSSCLPSDAITI